MVKSVEWNHRKISEPGLYSQISLETYHDKGICDGISISSSGLRAILLESPAHYWCRSPLNPNRVVDEKGPRYFVVGRAMHHLALGEPYFSNLFCAAPPEVPDSKGVMKEWSLRTNYAKAWVDHIEKQGRTPIFPNEIEKIRGMADALKSHPMIQAGILNGRIERSGFWRDEETGIWLKIRPDAVPTDSADVADFKTTTSVQWNDLARTIHEHGYHMQFALIREGFRKLGIPFHSATLVFVEKEQPHCVRTVTLSNADLDRGERQNRQAIRIFKRCLETKNWPGPGGDGSDAEEMALPDWATTQIDKQLEYMERWTR